MEASDLKAQGSTSDGIILYDESITRTGFSTKSGSNGYVITGDSKVESAIAEENMQNGFLLTGNGECSGCYAKLHTTSVTDNGAGFKLASGSPTVRNSRAIDNSKGFRVNSGEVIGGYAKGNSIGYIIEAFASVYGSTATDNSYGFKINRRGYGYELRATDNYYWGIDLEPSSEETPGGFVERPTALNNGNEYTTSAGGINVASGTRVDGPGVLCNNINYAMYGNTNAYVYGTFEADTLISPNLGGYYTIEECQRVATSGPKFHYQDALPEGEGILR